MKEVTSSIRPSDGGADPYGQAIASFFALDFPSANAGSPATVLEGLTTAFVASGQVRFGPSPNPESLVAIRDVLRLSVAAGRPIPVLVPWGGKKTRTGALIDVAEVAALKQLACLQRRVSEHYPAGIEVRIRLEDTGAYYLFAEEGLVARADIERYSTDFVTLVRTLGLHFVTPVRESTLMDETAYREASDRAALPLLAYLQSTDASGFDGLERRPEWHALQEIGWQGTIPVEQREYYRARYRTNYPGITPYDATLKLAQYLAGSLVRYQMRGTAANESWSGKYIQVSFVGPIPGAPVGLVSRNLYYRTVQLNMAKTHMPPWRCKGYLAINGEVVPKIASWNEGHPYVPHTTEFVRGDQRVTVQTDYVVV